MKKVKVFWGENWNIILGLIVLFFVSSNAFIHIFLEGQDWGELLWFCDVMSFILAFALFTKNKFLINTTFLASVPAQFMWIVDFFLELTVGGMGRTAWLFEDADTIFTPFISTVMHGILIPFSFYGIYKLGFVKRAIFGVYAIIVILLPVTYFFTDPTINRNCVFFPCDLNFVDDFKVINANADFYMTTEYLVSEMALWFIYSTAFYIFVLICFMLYNKLKIRFKR